MAELTLSDGQRSLELLATGTIWLKQDGLNLPIVGKTLTYAESADSEGRRRIRSKAENAEGSFSVFITGATNAEFWANVDNLQELVESAHENKGTIVYRPPNGTAVTFDLQSIQVTGMPQSGVNLRNRIAEVDVSFECLPYGRLPKQRLNLNGTYAEVVGTMSPAIFLPLTGTNGLVDLSGNARNGTGSGGVTIGTTAGPLTVADAGATFFDNSNDCITTTYNPFTINSTRTYMGWAYRGSSSGADTIFGGSVANPAVLALSSGSQNVTFKPQNSTTTTWTAAWPGNTQWVHWALMFNDTSNAVELYINGALVSATTNAQAYNATPGNFRIGTYNATTDPFDGRQAWVSVHESALTAAQIRAAYDAGKAQATLAGPIDSFAVSGIPGQVPAFGELTLTDASTQTRNHIEVGVQHKFNPSAPEPVQLNAVTQITALAGASNTRAGSIATNIIRGVLTTTPSAVCTTGSQPHTGRWKVRARVWPSVTGCAVRLAWRTGTSSFSREKWVTLSGSANWLDVDLGTVNIGTGGSWEARVECRARTGIPTLDVDVVRLIPAGGYTRLRGALETVGTGEVIAADNFDSHTAGNLHGKTPLVVPAGNWSTSGETTDLAVNTTTKRVERSVTTDATWGAAGGYEDAGGRWAQCGSGSAALVDVSCDLDWSRGWTMGLFDYICGGVYARYDTANNWVRAILCFGQIFLQKRQGGSYTTLGYYSGISPTTSRVRIRLTADTAGAVKVYADSALAISVTDSAFATAGALQTGRYGIFDAGHTSTPITRSYDNFVVSASVATDNPAIHSTRALTLTQNNALTTNSGGTGQGLTPVREGRYLTLPPATRNNERARVVVAARRLDVDEGFTDTGTADNLRASLEVTPRVHLTSP